MDWKNEIALFGLGMAPGFATSKQAVQAAVRQRGPTDEEIVKSAIAAMTGTVIISIIGGRIAEVAQYITLNQFINVNKTAQSGKVVWRMGPRLLPIGAYAYGSYQAMKHVGVPGARMAEQKFVKDGGADNVTIAIVQAMAQAATAN